MSSLERAQWEKREIPLPVWNGYRRVLKRDADGSWWVEATDECESNSVRATCQES